MNKVKDDIFIELILDDDELAVEQSLANDEYTDNSDFEGTKIMLEQVAKQHKYLQEIRDKIIPV